MFAGTTVRLVFRMIADCAKLRIAMPTTLQRPFPDQYLLAYSADHVFYEVDHFFWLADVISRPTTIFSAQSPDAAVRTKNIFIEGFGLHLRNIIDFLYPRRLRVTDTDIVAADFLPNGKWDAIKPPISATLIAARIRADKEIAHLTTDRICGTPPEKAWECQALANELKSIFRLMCDNALSSRLASNVGQRIS